MTLQEALQYLSQGGVTGLLLWGYWQERKERLASQERERALTQQVITAAVKLDDTLRSIGGILPLPKQNT